MHAVTREAGETGSGATEEAQIHSISIHTSTMEARFETVMKARECAKNHPPPKIQKVMFLMRDKQGFEKYYEPRVVSLGPIHHGKEKYKLGERYKLVLTYEFVNGSGKEIKDLYKKIEDNVEELRECFEEEVTKEYDDEALAWLLFVDGSAILQYIYSAANDMFKQLEIKADSVTFGQQDLFLLENQLPYRLLEWLMGLSKMENELRGSIQTYVAKHDMVPDNQQSKQQQENGNQGNLHAQQYTQPEKRISMNKEPVHLLDLLRSSLLVFRGQLPDAIYKHKEKDQGWESRCNVQEIRAAGIHLKRSSNSCLHNISFRRESLFFGHLYLPPIIVDDSTGPKFMNLIAYEMCLDFKNDFGITSYISFLNSLIDEANDVKMLRKARILHNFLGSNEEVAKLFNEIGTDLVPNPFIYQDVKTQIQEYRDSLLSRIFRFHRDHFGGTWSIAGFLGAVLALSLSGIQAWFTVNPASQRHS